MTKTFHHPALAAAIFTVGIAFAAPANADSLENLERERAILLAALLDADLKPEQRQKKVELSRNRLIDLERLVLRDKSLVGKNSPTVQAAFRNYDLTFMVHSAVEKNRALMDHWLDQVGVSTQSLMNARIGRR